jgi:hypothetical protein
VSTPKRQSLTSKARRLITTFETRVSIAAIETYNETPATEKQVDKRIASKHRARTALENYISELEATSLATISGPEVTL